MGYQKGYKRMLGIALAGMRRAMDAKFRGVPTTTNDTATEAVTKGAGYKSSVPSGAEAVEPRLWEQL